MKAFEPSVVTDNWARGPPACLDNALDVEWLAIMEDLIAGSPYLPYHNLEQHNDSETILRSW